MTTQNPQNQDDDQDYELDPTFQNIPAEAELPTDGDDDQGEDPPYRPVYNFDREIDEPDLEAEQDNQTDPDDPEDSDNPDDPDEADQAWPGSDPDLEDTYRFTNETPDIAEQHRRPKILYAAVIIVAIALVSAAAYYFLKDSGPDIGTAGQQNSEGESIQLSEKEMKLRVMHERIVENRQALNELIGTAKGITNETARMSIDLANVVGAIQQVQLPHMAQSQTAIAEKLDQLELHMKRLEEENTRLKQNQSEIILIEQQIQLFEREVKDTRQTINDQKTALDDTRELAQRNYSILQELGATPIPTDPVIRLAICMNNQIAKPPGGSGHPAPDLSEHFANTFRNKIAAGEMTIAAIEIRLANCLKESPP